MPLSPLYEFIMKQREKMYLTGKKQQYRPKAKVISVGNLTMGGTGKTPTVCYIAQLLQENNYKPCIISRGYTGEANKPINLVSDGKSVLLSAKEAGDEPYMLGKMLPGVPVITGKKRFITCEFATDNLGCNVLILDDGFQHLRIQRDLDIVLFDEKTGFGVDKVFPGGDLREPKSALNRADIFLITDSNNEKRGCSDVETFLKDAFPQIPIFHQTKKEYHFFLKGKERICRSNLPDKVGCFCGIANPDRFKNGLIKAGFSLKFFEIFKDHHHYSSSDIVRLCKIAHAHKIKTLITTDKDIVKLDTEQFSVPVISARLNINQPKQLDNMILQTLKEKV